MPELPEVETVRRGLAPVLEGSVIAQAVQRRADLRWPLPPRFAERLTGRRVERLDRRSKYILAALDGGETWLVHLGMSGRILIAPPEAAPAMAGAFLHTVAEPGPHDHAALTMADGTRITYTDARRFGAMDLWPTARIVPSSLCITKQRATLTYGTSSAPTCCRVTTTEICLTPTALCMGSLGLTT